MFAKLTDTAKAAIFSVLVLFMATGVALLIRILDLAPNGGMWILWSCTPTVAALLMLLVVPREGYSWEGWKVLCLHRLDQPGGSLKPLRFPLRSLRERGFSWERHRYTSPTLL